MLTCQVCGVELTPPERGRMPTYCGSTCRSRASRARKWASSETVQVQPRAVPPRQRKPTVDDLTRLVVDAHALETAFRFAAEHADYKMRPMCSRIADAITVALDAEGLSHG